MPIEIAKPDASPRYDLTAFFDLPVAILGDELNRAGIMQATLRPLGKPRFVGAALTVECMAGDNSALHYALAELERGQVIVCDARGHVDTAVWGEVMHTCAQARGAVAVVIDGAMRDLEAIRASTLPAFAKGVCPRGPHKGWGGRINHPIQCAGVAVSPGDLVVGDADGIIVIRQPQIVGLVERCRARIAREAAVMEKLRDGALTIEVLSMPPVEAIGK